MDYVSFSRCTSRFFHLTRWPKSSCSRTTVNHTTTSNTCSMTTRVSQTANSEDGCKDKAWTYFEMVREFPEWAGKFCQVFETLKRLALILSTKRNLSDDAKTLFISVAEGYDVGVEFLDWL